MHYKIYYTLNTLQNISLRYIFECNHNGAMLKLIKCHILLRIHTSLRSSNVEYGLKD